MAFWSRRRAAWDLAAVTPPWDTSRSSVYSHIQGLIAGGSKDLSTLPDDEIVSPPGALRWVAGGLDGAFGHHGGAQPGRQAVEVQKAVEAALDDPAPLKLQRLYGLLRQSALEYTDTLLERLSSRRLDLARLEDLAEWIARHAPDREPVKVAIALLGVIPQPQRSHDELLMTLGRHDELTLYVAVALSNSGPDSDGKLRQLAEHVHGWGRIQLVERLAGTQAPDIKRWLVREGYRNSIMYEYLAYTCATAGALAEEMAAARVDEALLAGAGDILRALITGGPAQDIEDYADGALVAERYLHHLGPQPATLEQLLVVEAVRRFLQRDGDWDGRASRGWTTDRRERLRTRCEAIVNLPHWRELLAKALQSEDDGEFAVANEAARVLGIDTWDRHYERLQNGAADWFFVMQTDDPGRIDRVLALAEERIPWRDIATGPAQEMGFGPEWARHSDLDFVLQGLQAFPGKGWSLIGAGMKSPLIRNRYTALKALSAWDRERWPPDAEAQLRQALTAEPDSELREAIATVMDGRPWPPPQQA
jgi:hypothetical protein